MNMILAMIPMIKFTILALAVLVPLAVLMRRVMRSGSVMLPHSPMFYIAILIPFAYLTSALVSPRTHDAILSLNFNVDSVVGIELTFLAMLVTILLSMQRRVSRKLARAVVLVSVVAVSVFILQVALQAFGAPVPRALLAANVISSWTDVAVLLALFVVFIFSGALDKYKTGVFGGAVPVAVLSVAMLLIGLFVNMFVAFVVISALALVRITTVLFDSKARKGARKALILPIIALVFSLGFIADATFFKGVTVAKVSRAMHISFVDVRPNWYGTLSVAKGVAAGDTKTKLFGTGPGTFAQQWALHRPAAVATTPYWNASFSTGVGFIPTAMATGGAVTSAVWVLFMLAVLVAVLRSRFSAMSLPTIFIWAVLFFVPAGLLLLLVASVITGLFIAEMVHNKRIKAVKYHLRGESAYPIIKYFALPAVALSTLLVLGIVAQRAIVSGALVYASSQMLQNHMSTAERTLMSLEKISSSPAIEAQYTQLAYAQFTKLLSDAQKQNKQVDSKLLQGALTNMLSHARATIQADPTNPAGYITLGQLSEQLMQLKIDGADKSAITAYTQAQKLDPRNPLLPFSLARIAVANKDTEEAQRRLQEAITLKPNFIPAIYAYGELQLAQGQVDEAMRAFVAVANLDPNHSNALYRLAGILTKKGDYINAYNLLSRVALLNKDNKQLQNELKALEKMARAQLKRAQSTGEKSGVSEGEMVSTTTQQSGGESSGVNNDTGATSTGTQ